MKLAVLAVLEVELGLPLVAVEPGLVMESMEFAALVVVVEPGLPAVTTVVEPNEVEATTQQSAAVLAVLVEPEQ
jgi:hypothetical protein